MKIIGANVTGSFILNGVDVTNTLQSSSIWSGSVASSINSLNAATASLNASTASLYNYTSSNTTNINTLFTASASLDASVTSLNAATASLNTATASFSSSIGSLNNATASFSSSIGSLNNTTASLNTATSSLNSSITSLNAATASLLSYTASQTALNGTFATTGSNTFVGTQYVSNTTQATTFTSTASLYTDGGLRIGKDAYVSGSAFIKGNLTVFGTSSIEYVTSSVFVGLEYIDLNTDLPALRYAGIRVYDSGSNVGVTGSLFWDSQTNHWVYTNPSGSSYSGGMMISGPRASSLGSEQGTTNNALMKGQGGDHITSSAILDNGSVVSFPYTINVTGSIVATTFTGSGAGLTSIPNAALTNSTISGISLGSNLATLTIGTGLSGTSYNGSTGVTISNSGVTSIVAGTGISVGSSTGTVTVTNTITNNNQLTNGAGYITNSTTSLSLTGNLTVSTGNTTGGGIILADDGDIVDLNDAFCSMRFSAGVRVFSANRGGSAVIKLGNGGDIVASADITAYGSPSDINLKENIKPLDNSLSKILKLQGVTFDWKEDSETRQYTNLKEDIGFIAQQVQEVVPELVRQNNNGFLSLRDKGITALLVEAIKEQQTQIEELKSIINGLTK